MTIKETILKSSPNYYEEIFTKNKLYFPKVKELNDPFDCMPILTFDSCNEIDLKKAFIEKFNVKNNTLISLGDLDAHLEKINLSIKEVFEKNYKERGIESFLKDRVLSLTKNPLCVLMWAHYSNNHTGFCLELSLNKQAELKKWIFPVKYKNKRPQFTPLDLMKEDFKTKFFVDTKNKSWKYEKEWRIFGHKVRSKIIPLPFGSISSVILGNKISKRNENRVRSWIEKSKLKIDIKRIEFAKNSFAISVLN